MKTKMRIRFWYHKKMILAICALTSVWLVMAVNAEDKQRKTNQKTQPGSSQAVVPAKKPKAKRSANQTMPIFFPELSKHELKIQAALNSKTECDFSETPLSKAMKLLAERHGIQILVIPHHLGEEGLTVDEPVNLSVKGIYLKNALDLMLKPSGLTYMVDQDVLKITTRIMEFDEDEYKARIYPVGDLVTSDKDYIELIDTLGQLMNLDYEGSLRLVKSSKSLVITQTYHAHNAIVDLLTQLRKARALD